MSYVATTKKCLPRIFVRQSLRHITDTKNPRVLVLTRCHVTDINHVLTPCHVIEINYVDRGVAARTPLQFGYTRIFWEAELTVELGRGRGKGKQRKWRHTPRALPTGLQCSNTTGCDICAIDKPSCRLTIRL